MKILMMHKNDAQTEAGTPPPMELVTKMGEFVGELIKAGKFVDGGGLDGSKTRMRLVFSGGRCTIKHGPYAGDHELPAAMLVLEVRTRDEAIGWAERYGKILGDGELELGRLKEPWDLGLVPAPENPPLHIMLVDKADPASESGGRSSQQKAALSRLKTEMTKAGVLVRDIPLLPSSKGKRIVLTKSSMRVLDGPFVESKELIGGFSIFEMAGIDEALALCRPYADILGGSLELDLRLVDAT